MRPILPRLRKVSGFLRWRLEHYLQNTRFDRRYGVETSRIERGYLAGIDVPDVECVEFYEPVTPDFFTRIADTAGIDPRGLGFLDLGSGKGRALILASLHGFRRIIGVELSGAMHEVAIENVAHFDHARGTASGIELAQGDATAFDIPEGDWVVFMYNPFSGVMMGRMLRRLEEFVEAGRGRVMIWYRTPQESWRFDASEVFGRVYKEHAFAIYDSGPSSVLREGHAPPSRSD